MSVLIPALCFVIGLLLGFCVWLMREMKGRVEP